MLKITYGMLFMLLFLPFVSFGQDSALVMPDWYTDGHTQYLNVDIASDTAASPSYQAGNRVYVLKKGGIYYWNRAFSVPKGRILKIASDNGASKYYPIIFLYQTGTGTGTQPIQPPGTLTTLNGGDLNLKNIMVSGYDETCMLKVSREWISLCRRNRVFLREEYYKENRDEHNGTIETFTNTIGV